jgi:hypothetical protein
MKAAETLAARATPTARTEGAVLLVDADPKRRSTDNDSGGKGFQVHTRGRRACRRRARPRGRPDAVILEVSTARRGVT